VNPSGLRYSPAGRGRQGKPKVHELGGSNLYKLSFPLTSNMFAHRWVLVRAASMVWLPHGKVIVLNEEIVPFCDYFNPYGISGKFAFVESITKSSMSTV
jgi:hypothetical protein